MSAIGITACVILAGLVGFVSGYVTGRESGEKLGRDREWMETFFRQIENDRQRREANGRFKPKTKAAN